MKKCVILQVVLLILFSALMLTGCTRTAGSPDNTSAEEPRVFDEDEELVFAINVDGSNPAIVLENVWLNRSKVWGSLIFQGLLIADGNINNVQPDLCEEYTISPDGKTYTFILKEDLFWHDGIELTSEDVKWSVETALKGNGLTNGYILKRLQNIVGAEGFVDDVFPHLAGLKVDHNVITFEINEQDSSFLSAIGQLAILPKHLLEEVPMEEFGTCDFWKAPVGSGPYKIVEVTGDQEVIMTVNGQYSGKMPKVKQIRYKVLADPENDYFDMTITSDPATIEKYQGEDDYAVVKTNNLYYRYLLFNLDGRKGENAELVDDVRVRRALALAIDKESIMRDIYRGAAVVIDSGVPYTDSWYKLEGKMEYDPEEARRLLEEAEYDFSKTLLMNHYSTDALSVQLMERIQECWEAVGVKAEVVPLTEDVTNRLFVENDWYDIALKNLSAVDYSEWYYEYDSENPVWNGVLKGRKEFDVPIDSLDTAQWAYEKDGLYNEIQDVERSQVYKIPLAIVPQYIIYNKKNLYIPEQEFPNLWYYYDLDVEQWEVLKAEQN